jgi:hypothetical protein
LEIYHIKKLIEKGEEYRPYVYEIPKYRLERICDFFFWSENMSEAYCCYLACKVVGHKKFKVFDIHNLHSESIWETESNSINFFEDLSEHFMLELNVLTQEKIINVIFVNGNEQFTITMNEKKK